MPLLSSLTVTVSRRRFTKSQSMGIGRRAVTFETSRPSNIGFRITNWEKPPEATPGRGTDIFKALALGATAVGIGRPQAWGLAAFGQLGVEAVLEILRRESKTIMRQAGTTSVDEITRSYVVARPS